MELARATQVSTEHVFVSARRAGQLGMVAINVLEEEPVSDADHLLLNMLNVVATPHIG